jgi:hypothetical protein
MQKAQQERGGAMVWHVNGYTPATAPALQCLKAFAAISNQSVCPAHQFQNRAHRLVHDRTASLERPATELAEFALSRYLADLSRRGLCNQ